MYFVYILRSIEKPEQTYVGSTSNIGARLLKHNTGANRHTRQFKPWQLIWFSGFPNKTKAAAFEHYLKTASGIAFRRKRLI